MKTRDLLINTTQWCFCLNGFTYKISVDSGDVFINVEGRGLSFNEKIPAQDKKRDKGLFITIMNKIGKIDTVMQKVKQERYEEPT
jgi:hypothetical protein